MGSQTDLRAAYGRNSKSHRDTPINERNCKLQKENFKLAIGDLQFDMLPALCAAVVKQERPPCKSPHRSAFSISIATTSGPVCFDSGSAQFGRTMLQWQNTDDVYRAYDELAMYVISQEELGHFFVGYFPSPGPICMWSSALSVDAAKKSAELCAEFVRKLRLD
jgi:hypothetical protein